MIVKNWEKYEKSKNKKRLENICIKLQKMKRSEKITKETLTK